MKNINWKYVIYIVLGIFCITSLVIFWTGEKSFTIDFILDSISTSVPIITFLSCLFCTKLWKLKCFQKWLVLIPDINGTWTGTIESTWVNPETGHSIDPINAELVIHQSLFSITCFMKTGEMRSHSLCASLNIDFNSEISQLIYTYTSTPKQTLQEKSRIHYGTALLNLEGNFNVSSMSGDYWTGRTTSGSIYLKRV